MANRAVNNGELDVSREAINLENDDSWQARLEEARARREVALREKAAGKTAPKKRLKPWEVDGTIGKKPIEPIVQEREDDRIDFADRVQTIREVSKQAEGSADPGFARRGHNSAAFDKKPTPELQPTKKTRPAISIVETLPEPTKPPSPDEFDEALTVLSEAKPVLRDVSLVLPDAPDVSDLAARYASTLAPEAEEIVPEVEEEEPIAAAAPEVAVQQELRYKRPLALALASMTLAMVPLVSKLPAFETGPAMPGTPVFAMQPALGVTWSLQETPVPTRSGEWAPRVSWAPKAPVQPISGQPTETTQHVDGLAVPSFGESLQLGAWVNVKPVGLGQGTTLFTPEPDAGISAIAGSVNPANVEATNVGVADQTVPAFGNAPAKPRPSAIPSVQSDRAADEASLVMPPKKAPLSDLKVTILVPNTGDKRTAASIASDLESQGHRVVRLKDVSYSISARNLRYFYEGDELEAERLAELYDAELRDFTWYRPKPEVGTTELWLSGKSARANPVRSARKASTTPTALQPPAPQRVLPAPTANVQQKRNRGFLGRLFGGHRPQGGQVNAQDGGRTASNVAGHTGSTSATTPSGSVNTSADDIDTSVTPTGTGADAGTDGSNTGTSGATSAGTGTNTGTTNTGSTNTGTDAGTSGSGTGATDAGTGGTDAGTSTTDSGTGSTDSDGGSDTSTGGSDSGSGGSTDDTDSGSRGNNGNGNGGGNGGGKGNSRSGT